MSTNVPLLGQYLPRVESSDLPLQGWNILSWPTKLPITYLDYKC